MPQSRRKVPFSGKAKKEQLKNKRQSKQQHYDTNNERTFGTRQQKHNTDETNEEGGASEPGTAPKSAAGTAEKFDYASFKDGFANRNRYALLFYKESSAEIKARKTIACQTIEPVADSELEIKTEEFYPSGMEFPKRPKWSYELSSYQLESQEIRYFNEYVNGLNDKFNWKEMGFFELNLETWRQLWRVLEMSDILLYIVDIRFPAHMFPPSLYDYVTNTLKKDFVLVLNKIDLAPPELVVAWKHFFKENYPRLHITMFTSLPGYNLVGTIENKAGLKMRRRRGKIKIAAEGGQNLYEICKGIVGNDLDITSWETKIKEEMNLEYEGGDDNDDPEDDKVKIGKLEELKTIDTGYFEHEKFKNGMLTVGCVGHPNVGKSSVINALMGRKVVSVSRTPGHTKHFQTIFLTPNVRLCDCPGLVFPSKTPKTLQVLMGSFPIAQLREPFTTIKFLGERLNLPSLLRIEHPENDTEWCAMDVCDGWAKKRGFVTARAARLDSYRAANDLLRMSLDGQICLALRPLGYEARGRDHWASSEDYEKVKWIQAFSKYSEVDNTVGENSRKNNETGSDESDDETSDSKEEDSSSDDGMASNVVRNKFDLLNLSEDE